MHRKLLGASFALTLLALAPSTSFAQAELVPGVFYTDRTGFAGTQTTTLGAPSGEHAVSLITAGERSNRPCYLSVAKHDINDWDDPIYELWNDCPTVSAASVQSAGWYSGDGLFVYGVAACTNMNPNGRLKGIFVYGGTVTSDGEFIPLGAPSLFARPNCDQWHDGVFCPEGEVATKVVLHHTGDEINGLSLGCRAVTEQ